jgi:hypothetical protein
VKASKPKPVILEPAHVSLARLGREMGSSDVPAAELVRDSILSAEASREVDRLIGASDREFWDRVDDDMRRGITLSKRCMSCSAICTAYGVKHADDCDLDRSLTAEQRYALRNPGHNRRTLRLLLIKTRWALINGRCIACWRRSIDSGKNYCAECRERINARRSEIYALRKQAVEAETARAA